MNSTDITTFHRRAFAAAVMVYICAAWFSTGFQNADEHYQVITFAQWKTGDPNMGPLPWEFYERIRSSVLPWTVVVLFKSFSILGVDDPFTLTFLLRSITALLALLTMKRFVIATLRPIDPSLRRPYIILSYFLWFLPFLLVRFSSETWSLIALLHLLALLYQRKENGKWPWWTGIWLGILICIKPSMLPAAIGIGLWALLIAKPKAVSVLQTGVSILLVLLLSAAIDSLFYGVPAFSFGNYLHANFPSHPGHVFDSFPWWYYAPWIVKYAIPPIGLCMLVGFLILLRYHVKSLLTWCILPVVIALSIVPHKELRFLYPLAGLVPLLLITAFSSVRMHWRNHLGATALWKPVLLLVGVINILALAVVISSPAANGRTALAQAIGKKYPGHPLRVEYLEGGRDIWDIRIPEFYLPSGTTQGVIQNACAPMKTLTDTLVLLISDHAPAPCPNAGFPNWEPVKSALPWWTEKALWLYDWEDTKPTWRLYEKRP